MRSHLRHLKTIQKIYKRQFNLRKYFKNKKQKIILFTTSSWDEVIGTALLYYKNPKKYMLYSQTEAIKKAIEFVKKKKKLRSNNSSTS